ncbi:MAG: hypothetical protein JSW60_06705 [Thermoplasmatales archaeon]|nr:MAG: hypothetical protein JSW60_06705 [Thermoplasmatales archaeon]
MAKGDNEVAKTATNKAGENPQFLRTNNEARDAFVERAIKELKCEVRDLKTKAKENPVEKMLVFDGRQICHCANRSGHLFTVGIRTLNGKNDIRKLKNNKEVEKAFDSLKELCLELDKKPPEKNNKKKSNKGDKTKVSHKSVEEHTESLLRRMAECKNSGISIPKEVDPNATWFQNLVKEKGWKIDEEKNAILKGD